MNDERRRAKSTSRKPTVSQGLTLTDTERRQILTEDRRLAIESIRDLLKWTIAALLTLNSGAALATFTKDDIPQIIAAPVAGIFVMGAGMAIGAGMFATLTAVIASEIIQDKLGLDPTRFGKALGAMIWLTILLVPFCVGGSFYALMQGIEAHARLSQLDDKERAALRGQSETTTAKPVPAENAAASPGPNPQNTAKRK